MGDTDDKANRDLRGALLQEMTRTIEVLESLLGVLRRADLTEKQKAVVARWESMLPEMRQSLQALAEELGPGMTSSAALD